MKLYEKKNERKEGKSEAQAPIDENEWKEKNGKKKKIVL